MDVELLRHAEPQRRAAPPVAHRDVVVEGHSASVAQPWKSGVTRTYGTLLVCDLLSMILKAQVMRLVTRERNFQNTKIA
jgi:hypothetical protein